jgi:hypothetical protein
MANKILNLNLLLNTNNTAHFTDKVTDTFIRWLWALAHMPWCPPLWLRWGVGALGIFGRVRAWRRPWPLGGVLGAAGASTTLCCWRCLVCRPGSSTVVVAAMPPRGRVDGSLVTRVLVASMSMSWSSSVLKPTSSWSLGGNRLKSVKVRGHGEQGKILHHSRSWGGCLPRCVMWPGRGVSAGLACSPAWPLEQPGLGISILQHKEAMSLTLQWWMKIDF